MSLADILAKKKLATEQADTEVVTLRMDKGDAAVVAANPAKAIAYLEAEAARLLPVSFQNTEVAKTMADPVKQEVAAVQVEKPMTFAEKMAFKKTQTAVVDAAALPTLASATVISTPAPVVTEVVEPAKVINPATEQAYADIKAKIDLLSSLSDTPLEGAMKDLKKALMSNPAAVELMEPIDFGKMVTALRIVVGEAAVEAIKDPKKKKEKKVNLANPEDIEALFESL